ncbi:MAG TPA: VOC family protein [Methylomirabilota bacterium]|nr:VOC family protein [Methylomirabilota bacterium]
MAIKIRRTGHLVLSVKDLQRSKRFFTEVMGFKISGESDNGMIFFSPDFNDNHHMLAIRQAKQGAEMPDKTRVGMDHVAYELGSFAELQDAYRIFKDKGVTIHHTVFHGVTKSIYFLDPDGNMLEVYCNVPPDVYKKVVTNPFGFYSTIEEELEGSSQKPGTVIP